MEVHPKVNDPVVLRDHADREYLSRVEDIGEGLLVVARPHDLPADEEFGAGTELSVAWVDPDRGVRMLPTRILAAHAQRALLLWSLLVTGPASVDQRRRFVRVRATGPVLLQPAEGDQTGPVRGRLVDVSEGGIRCTVEAGAADGLLTGHDPVTAAFALGTVDFAIPGHVEFLRATAHPSELEDLVVVFDEPVEHADALRKQVFAQQLRTLQARREGDS